MKKRRKLMKLPKTSNYKITQEVIKEGKKLSSLKMKTFSLNARRKEKPRGRKLNSNNPLTKTM
jgi:hypothetical protein